MFKSPVQVAEMAEQLATKLRALGLEANKWILDDKVRVYVNPPALHPEDKAYYDFDGEEWRVRIWQDETTDQQARADVEASMLTDLAEAEKMHPARAKEILNRQHLPGFGEWVDSHPESKCAANGLPIESRWKGDVEGLNVAYKQWSRSYRR